MNRTLFVFVCFSFFVYTFIHCVLECTGSWVDRGVALVVVVHNRKYVLLVPSYSSCCGIVCHRQIVSHIHLRYFATAFFATASPSYLRHLGVDRFRFTSWTQSRSPQQWPFVQFNVFPDKSHSCQNRNYSSRFDYPRADSYYSAHHRTYCHDY